MDDPRAEPYGEAGDGWGPKAIDDIYDGADWRVALQAVIATVIITAPVLLLYLIVSLSR